MSDLAEPAVMAEQLAEVGLVCALSPAAIGAIAALIGVVWGRRTKVRAEAGGKAPPANGESD